MAKLCDTFSLFSGEEPSHNFCSNAAKGWVGRRKVTLTTGATAVESKAAGRKLSDEVVGRGAWSRRVGGVGCLGGLGSPLVEAYSAREPIF